MLTVGRGAPVNSCPTFGRRDTSKIYMLILVSKDL